MADTTEEKKQSSLKERERIRRKLKELLQKSHRFDQEICEFPTQSNRIKNIYKRNKSYEAASYIVECAESTRIIIHKDVFEFMDDFIRHKQHHGSHIEKVVYEEMTPRKLAVRLISKRPLYFFGRHDRSLLRNGTTPPSSAWPTLGKDDGDDSIDYCEYISYDEMQLSALCGVSSPTVFINSGARHNQGVASSIDDFEERGVYVGLVGARFEKTEQMESTHIVVAKRNNEEAGYGKSGESSERRQYLSMWAKLYQQGGSENPHFPSYEEVQTKAAVGTFCPLKRLGAHFNVKVFKRRMRFVVEPFLLDANQRGKEAKKKVYAFAVGLGLGVWAIDSRTQGKYLVDIFSEVIREQELSSISVLDFSWFPDIQDKPGIPKHGRFIPTENGNEIEILFTNRNPADKLKGKYAGMLAVACFAWDGNSFPGNEYWGGMLCASGDPAAACCSMIPEIQNAEVNETLTKESAVTFYPQ